MKTRSLSILTLMGGAVLLALAAPGPISGQEAVVISSGSPQLTVLLKEIQLQNAELAQNQALMDEKIEKLSEVVRQARIYAARSGGGKGGVK